MLWKVVRRELLDHMTSFRFGAVFALSLLLLVTSTMVFSAHYETVMRELPRRVERLVDEDGKTDLSQVPWTNSYVLARAPSPLAFCAGSAERELPNAMRFAVHSINWLGRKGEVDGFAAAAGAIDWAFIIGVLLSFAAGLLTYRSIAGEQQDGTLTLVLANPLSRGTLLGGKYLAALLALGVALVFGMVSSLLVLQIAGKVQLAAAHWGKLFFVGAISLLYLSCFVLIGLLCSIFSRNATIAAIAFLFSWTFLVFVVPNLGGILAGRIGAVRTPYQIMEFGANIRNQIPVTAGMDARDEGKVRLKREYAREKLLLDYVDELARQVELGKNLTRISPTPTFIYAIEEVTGGGI